MRLKLLGRDMVNNNYQYRLREFVLEYQDHIFYACEKSKGVEGIGAAKSLQKNPRQMGDQLEILDEKQWAVEVDKLNSIDTEKAKTLRFRIGIIASALTVISILTLASTLSGSPSLAARVVLIITTSAFTSLALGALGIGIYRKRKYNKALSNLAQQHVVRIQELLIQQLLLLRDKVKAIPSESDSKEQDIKISNEVFEEEFILFGIHQFSAPDTLDSFEKNKAVIESHRETVVTWSKDSAQSQVDIIRHKIQNLTPLSILRKLEANAKSLSSSI